MHAKTLFFGVWKNTIVFFSFETLGRMHKNIFSFFKFFCILFLEVLTKTGYFNTGFVFLRHKILPDINQNDIKTTRENCKILKQIFLKIFLNGLGQAQIHGLGRTWPNYMSPDHISWLRCMSTVTSFFPLL